MTEPMTPSPPRSGDDTYDLIDGALYQLAERRGSWLGDPVAAITLLASLIDQAERMIPMSAAEASANGATWTDIATALGTSPEQAELRYSPDSRSPTADGPTTTTKPNPRTVTSQPIEGSEFRCRQRVRIQTPLTAFSNQGCLHFAATCSLASKDVTTRYRRGPFRVVVKACRGCINVRAACLRYPGKHLRRRVNSRAAGDYPTGDRPRQMLARRSSAFIEWGLIYEKTRKAPTMDTVIQQELAQTAVSDRRPGMVPGSSGPPRPTSRPWAVTAARPT